MYEPGGPDKRAAFQGPFGELYAFSLALGLLKVFSHVLSPIECEMYIYITNEEKVTKISVPIVRKKL